MQAVQKFRTEPMEGRERAWLVSDEGLSVEVEGVILEAQFQCSRGYLVITSDDNPHEETLHFYFLSEAGQVLDEVSLGQIYHSGILRNAAPHADDRLEFSFFGTERWCLTILDKPRFQPPSLFSSVRLKGRFGSHYLSLRKTSQNSG
jgi:hypothetical protein